jgi:hypothetical protein
MFEEFLPNDLIREDPLDFQRYVAGLSYQYNEYLRFALDTQALMFYHSQFPFPVSYAKTFGFTSPKGFKATAIDNPVPRDTQAVFLNAEFSY